MLYFHSAFFRTQATLTLATKACALVCFSLSREAGEGSLQRARVKGGESLLYIIANWKMHGSKTFVQDFMHAFSTCFVPNPKVSFIICPPTLYIQSLCEQIKILNRAFIQVGAQHSFAGTETEAAFTGEISASMLRDSGCQYLLMGHSERRQYFAQTEAQIVQQGRSAYNAGLVPILCVGESLEQRQAGQTFKVIEGQLESFLSNVGVDFETQDTPNLIIAYEPLWAIGTGLVATPVQSEEVHAWIRAYVEGSYPLLAKGLSIVYGGSVKPGNSEGLLAQPHIDGLLIGGASLEAKALADIYAKAVSI